MISKIYISLYDVPFTGKLNKNNQQTHVDMKFLIDLPGKSRNGIQKNTVTP